MRIKPPAKKNIKTRRLDLKQYAMIIKVHKLTTTCLKYRSTFIIKYQNIIYILFFTILQIK